MTSSSGAKKWIVRFMRAGRGREMGVGSYPETTLADARLKKLEARRLLAAGIDPIEQRRALERARSVPTFGTAAGDYFAAHSSSWRSARHANQWRSSIEAHCQAIHDRPVDKITAADVLAVLTPIWNKTPETASRVRSRIETVLSAAQANGHIGRNEANPARWRGHLEKLLPSRKKIEREHFVALNYPAVPEFMSRLREIEAARARALEFAILTAARSGEVLGARWSEIDLDARIWKISASRMKAGREHRIPLGDRAATILVELWAAREADVVFSGRGRDRRLSDTALTDLLESMDVDATVHGFRSAFRDWAGDMTPFPRELAEHALAHVMGDKAEQAYRRGDALEKRRALMAAWEQFCGPAESGKVVAIRRKG